MSLTNAKMSSLRDRHIELETAKVETPTSKAVKTKKVEKLGGKKKGTK